jgi:hypothetical protein
MGPQGSQCNKCKIGLTTLCIGGEIAQHVKLLADSHPEMHKQIESVLSEKIDYYLQAFLQKCSAL